jgi:hypothetical protein
MPQQQQQQLELQVAHCLQRCGFPAAAAVQQLERLVMVQWMVKPTLMRWALQSLPLSVHLC